MNYMTRNEEVAVLLENAKENLDAKISRLINLTSLVSTYDDYLDIKKDISRVIELTIERRKLTGRL